MDQLGPRRLGVPIRAVGKITAACHPYLADMAPNVDEEDDEEEADMEADAPADAPTAAAAPSTRAVFCRYRLYCVLLGTYVLCS